MKIKTILLSVLLAGCALTAKAQEKILLTGSANRAIMLVDKKSGAIEWEYPLEAYSAGIECNSVEITPQGNILLSYKKGARLIDRDHKVLWDYAVPKGNELHSVCQLKKGYLVAVNGNPLRIIELDAKGKCRKEILVKENICNDNAHAQCRQIRKARNGNFLVPVLGKSILYEINKKGETVRKYNLKGCAFSVTETRDGKLVLPLGDSHAIQVLDRKSGKELAYIGQHDLPGCKLLFVGQVMQLENGHWMVANWSGHGTEKEQPQLIEFDMDGKVYWTLKGAQYGTVSTFDPVYDENK